MVNIARVLKSALQKTNEKLWKIAPYFYCLPQSLFFLAAIHHTSLLNFFTQGVCTEAGMYALRERRVHVTQEDFEMAVAKVHSSYFILFLLTEFLKALTSQLSSPYTFRMKL